MSVLHKDKICWQWENNNNIISHDHCPVSYLPRCGVGINDLSIISQLSISALLSYAGMYTIKNYGHNVPPVLDKTLLVTACAGVYTLLIEGSYLYLKDYYSYLTGECIDTHNMYHSN